MSNEADELCAFENSVVVHCPVEFNLPIAIVLFLTRLSLFTWSNWQARRLIWCHLNKLLIKR